MPANFTDILSKPAEEIQKPKPKPVGTYLCAVQGVPTVKTANTKDGEKTVVEFLYKAMAAHQVDDQDALADAGDLANWTGFRQAFWPESDGGEYALVKHLTDTLGIDKKGKTLGEIMAEAAGKQALVTTRHRPYIDRNSGQPEIATEVDRVSAV